VTLLLLVLGDNSCRNLAPFALLPAFVVYLNTSKSDGDEGLGSLFAQEDPASMQGFAVDIG